MDDGFKNKDLKQTKETERFYNISYFVIPLPMIAGLAFAAWVLLTEDGRTKTFCTVAESASAYQTARLNELQFPTHEENTLDICKALDHDIDANDGRTAGQVRWFICKGTTCGPGWQTTLTQK